MQNIYNDPQLDQIKSTQSEDPIIYLDDFKKITLGKLIKKTKKVIEMVGTETTIVIMVTNTRYLTDIPSHVQLAYTEYGNYIQSLIKKGYKFTIVFRGIVSIYTLVTADCTKFISQSSFYDSSTEWKGNDGSTLSTSISEKFNIKTI